MPKLSVRLSHHELSLVDHDARANHLDRSDWVRFCLLGEVPQRRKPQPQVHHAIRSTAVALQEGITLLNELMLLELPPTQARAIAHFRDTIHALYQRLVKTAIAQAKDSA